MSTVPLTPEDAKRIADVLASADGYCTECARDLADQMQQIAPEHDWRKLVSSDDQGEP